MRISVGDVSYYVERDGSGEPLVLLHGFTGSADTWADVAAVLRASFDVITVDLLGHGRSDSPPEPERYTMERSLDDLAALLDALKVESAHVLGYSMGGRVALAFAATYPQRVRRLILESASPGLRRADERSARAEADAKLADRLEGDGLPAFVAYWENLPLFATQRRLPEDAQVRVRAGRLAGSVVGLANSLRGLSTGRQPSYWDALPSLTLPVLLVAGNLDTKYCLIAHEMRALLPDATLVIVPDAGHTVHLEAPDAFGQAALDFLAR